MVTFVCWDILTLPVAGMPVGVGAAVGENRRCRRRSHDNRQKGDLHRAGFCQTAQRKTIKFMSIALRKRAFSRVRHAHKADTRARARVRSAPAFNVDAGRSKTVFGEPTRLCTRLCMTMHDTSFSVKRYFGFISGQSRNVRKRLHPLHISDCVGAS
jgi:hypothetical protein